MAKNKEEQQQAQDHKFLFGFFTGLASFLTYEYLKDPSKRKQIAKEASLLKEELLPFFNEFKKMAAKNDEILKAVQAIDEHVGTNLLSVLSPDGQDISVQDSKEKKVSSIRQFFKLKK